MIRSREPLRLRWMALIILTAINLLNYIDRFIFSALLPSIKEALNFSDTQLGLLGSAFIFSYLFISPVFGFLGDRGGRSRVMVAGVAIWSIATAFSGLTRTFFGQVLTRISVGVGESAYSVIAPSVIADHFSKHSRGKVFAIYSGAIPVGSALGFIIGGFLEPRIGWERAFFVVGLPGLLLAALLFFMRDPERGRHEKGVPENAQAGPIRQVYGELFTNGGFLCSVLGYAAYTFVVGGMAFWMPTYIVRYFNVSLERGNLVFGGVTVVGGFVGTILGGWWSDRIERRTGNGYLKVSVWAMVLAVPLFFLTLAMRDFNHFAIALFFMEVALFLCISPLDTAVIGYVRPALRSTAMALNVFLIHLLGDGISRVLMGAVSDASGLHAAISVLPWVLILAGLIWQAGIVFFWQAVPWPANAMQVPHLQAHRGYRPGPETLENTIEAFRLAHAEGAEMFECDVHLTSDGQAVVFHDFDLQRIAGRPDQVASLTAAQMWEYAKAPLLRDVLLDPHSPRLVNVELKSASLFGSSRLASAVVEAVREAGAEGRVLCSSFNPFALRALSKRAPNIPRALLATSRPHPRNKIYYRKLWLAFFSRPHLVHLDDEMITKESMRSWSSRGITVIVWTVNDPARAAELRSLGVHGIISDVLFAGLKTERPHVGPSV